MSNTLLDYKLHFAADTKQQKKACQNILFLIKNNLDLLPGNLGRIDEEEFTFLQLTGVLKHINQEQQDLLTIKSDTKNSIEKSNKIIKNIDLESEKINLELNNIKKENEKNINFISSNQNNISKPTTYDEFITDKNPGLLKSLFLLFVSRKSIEQAQQKISDYEQLQTALKNNDDFIKKKTEYTTRLNDLLEKVSDIKRDITTAKSAIAESDMLQIKLSGLSGHLMRNINILVMEDSDLKKEVYSSLNNTGKEIEENHDEDLILGMDLLNTFR
ncbi:hypothetical protein [Legionella spiritensis]|uniref:hypothetical protein n=1 Tax=Legionella spiritensis TaxID=452 RepID=UPI000F6ED491|nr:hypothetical protein [Legionella spiritensis]VEG91802.1 Uncharacterised protein [Legionella spiritensis]